jgi:catechol 2,3-dioxygenase-like lactoylglutathione lyase family enzyme
MVAISETDRQHLTAARSSASSTSVSDAPYVPASYPRLLVRDADRAVTFYGALGFELVHRDRVFAHLRWAPQADVYLVSTPPGLALDGTRGVGVILCFDTRHVDLETVAERARTAGATVDGPRDQPWFTRELSVIDPDGYRLAFVTPG